MNLLWIQLDWAPSENGSMLCITSEKLNGQRFAAKTLFTQHQSIIETIKHLRGVADVLEAAERIST